MVANQLSHRLQNFFYRRNRAILQWLTRPSSTGKETLRQATENADVDVVYVLHSRGLTDLIVLDLVTAENNFPAPTEWLPISLAEAPDASDQQTTVRPQKRFFCLNRASGLVLGRHTMQSLSPGLINLHALLERPAQRRVLLVPVTTIWGRIPNRERSIMRLLVSEQWSVTSRFRRFFTLIFNRRDILLQFGPPLDFNEILTNDVAEELAPRRTARLLRRRFSNQRHSVLGPDLSHQRTLVDQIVASRNVSQAITSVAHAASASGKSARVKGLGKTTTRKLRARARKNAESIASNMSYTVIRLFDGLLRLLWTRMYDGVTINGLDLVRENAQENTLIYVPCHRSHIDYRLLSYQLFHAGLSLPHIAAGENLNMPVVGPLLRRGGAFFMRRRFRDDRIYSAVFTEYLYQVYRRGHSVEYFIEGGRSRSGRLLPAQTGILNMTLEHNERGLPKPLVFVPVYFAYERLIESGAYLKELRGEEKKGESLGGLFSSLKLLRQSFGEVTVNFGSPMQLTHFIKEHDDLPRSQLAKRLGQVITQSINNAAHVTPINLVSLVTLATPRIAIEEAELSLQLESMLQILDARPPGAEYTVSPKTPAEIIAYVEELDMLQRESTAGTTPGSDILSHDPATAVLMTWYRNNVLHLLALPSLLACLLQNQQQPVAESELQRMVAIVHPYLQQELSIPGNAEEQTSHWLRALTELGLLHAETQGNITRYSPPTENAADSAHTPSASATSHSAVHRLQALSQVILQTLERHYIVVATLAAAGQGALTRSELEVRCHAQAQRMSRLQGLNAPEFFDMKLIRGIITLLFNRGVLFANADERLNFNETIHQVHAAAELVIDVAFRQALLRG